MAALDQNLLALMNDTVEWEQFESQDGHGDPSYAAAVTLSCWIEEKGLMSGGMQAHRQPHADTYDSLFDLYFDASDSRVQAFDLRDRFTVTTQTVAQHSTQPDRLLTFRDEGGNAVVTVVTL